MEYSEFKEIIKRQVKLLKIELSEDKIKKFYNYMNLLIEWNQKINLTSITDPKEIILKHFIDSLTINKYIKENTKMIDVGTGAGFPGIPLKILRDDIEIILLDSLNKRIKFLDIVIEELKLNKISTIHSRAEDIGRDEKYREKFDYSTSRAVANLSTLAEYLIPLVKIKGEVIAMKGAEIKEELETSKKSINVLGGKLNSVEEFCLPESNMKRNVIIIQKETKTPNKFPRKAGLPSKEPIN